MHETLPPPPTHHSSLTFYYPPSLGHTGFVYVRIDKHKTPLQRPYEGPYRIISTSEKFFTLDVNGRTENISVDRLKTAYLATGRYPPQLNNQEEDKKKTPSSSTPLPNKSPGITTTRSGRSVRRPPHIVKDYIAGIQESYNNAGGGAMWRPISWRARKTHVTRNVSVQACVKTLTMIFANVRAVFVRAFIIKSALLETGHVSRSQIVCSVSKRYNASGVLPRVRRIMIITMLQRIESFKKFQRSAFAYGLVWHCVGVLLQLKIQIRERVYFFQPYHNYIQQH